MARTKNSNKMPGISGPQGGKQSNVDSQRSDDKSSQVQTPESEIDNLPGSGGSVEKR